MDHQLAFDLPVTPKPGISWVRYGTAWRGQWKMLRDGHATGIWVCHCGHPTALRPYYIVGDMHSINRKHRLLKEAQAMAVAALDPDFDEDEYLQKTFGSAP